MTDLTLETREQANETPVLGEPDGITVMVTPPMDEDYWTYRVRLTDRQAVVGFPKFLTIGIGFAHETDWNTNLPYVCSAAEIAEHIMHNAGEEAITTEQVIEAIKLIQAQAHADRGTDPKDELPVMKV